MRNNDKSLKQRNKENLTRFAETGEREALHAVILDNLNLSRKCAQKFAHFMSAAMDKEDVVHEGITGMIDAAKRFDVSRNLQFSTYSHWWIERNIRRALADRGVTIRYPENFMRKLSTLRKLELQFPGHPDDGADLKQYILEHSEITDSEYDDIRKIDWACSQVGSLHELRNFEDDEREIGEDIAYGHQQPHMTFHEEYQDAADLCCKQERKQMVEQLLAGIPDLNRRAIILLFGLGGENKHTIASIAKHLQMNRSQAERLIQDSLSMCRTTLHELNISFADIA